AVNGKLKRLSEHKGCVVTVPVLPLQEGAGEFRKQSQNIVVPRWFQLEAFELMLTWFRGRKAGTIWYLGLNTDRLDWHRELKASRGYDISIINHHLLSTITDEVKAIKNNRIKTKMLDFLDQAESSSSCQGRGARHFQSRNEQPSRRHTHASRSPSPGPSRGLLPRNHPTGSLMQSRRRASNSRSRSPR
ncbi:hypothetical protein BS17DRAFT_361406, partial [Gyrodon lividus]